MATASVVSPGLSTRRSSQSGNKAMTAAYGVVYTQSSVATFVHLASYYDLSSMLAGDVIDIRVRLVLLANGPWVLYDTLNYVGAMPAGHAIAAIGQIVNLYGLEVSMRQTAGILRTIPVEIFDALRLGL